MARRVADVRLGLAIVAGMHPRDPESVPVLLDVPRPASRRVALLAEPPGGDTHPEIAAAVRRAGDALVDAGYDVVEAEPPLYEQALDVWGRFLFADVRASEALLRQVMGADAHPLPRPRRRALPGAGRRRAASGRWSSGARSPAPGTQFLARAPADPQPDLDAAAVPARLGRRVARRTPTPTMRLMRPVMPANLLGLPAAAVPRRQGRRPARGRAGHGRAFPGARLPGGRGGDRDRARRRRARSTRFWRSPLASRLIAFASDSEGRDMRTTTTAVLAVGATALAIPTTAAHAQVQSSVQAPLAGHLTVASQMQAEHTELAQQRLTRKAWRLADRVADARDRGFSPRAYRRRGQGRHRRPRLARRVRALRRDLHVRPPRRAPPRRASPPPPRSRRSPPASPAATRAPTPATASTASSSSRCRRGRASAAHGNPAAASEAEQNRRAAMLYAREGASPWPVCGR